MTNEEIERRIIQLAVNTICYCEITSKAKCKTHKRLLEVASSLVSRAYEEAAQAAGAASCNDFHCCTCADAAERDIRALKDSLVQEPVSSLP